MLISPSKQTLQRTFSWQHIQGVSNLKFSILFRKCGKREEHKNELTQAFILLTRDIILSMKF